MKWWLTWTVEDRKGLYKCVEAGSQSKSPRSRKRQTRWHLSRRRIFFLQLQDLDHFGFSPHWRGTTDSKVSRQLHVPLGNFIGTLWSQLLSYPPWFHQAMRSILQPTHKRPRTQPILVKAIWWGPQGKPWRRQIIWFLYRMETLQTTTTKTATKATTTATTRRPNDWYPGRRRPAEAARQSLDQRRQILPHPCLAFKLLPLGRFPYSRLISRRSWRRWQFLWRPICSHFGRHRHQRISLSYHARPFRNKEADGEAASIVKPPAASWWPAEYWGRRSPISSFRKGKRARWVCGREPCRRFS